MCYCAQTVTERITLMSGTTQREAYIKPKNSKYKSGFEVKIAKSLEEQGIEVKYEQTKIKFTVPPKDRNYIPDFELPNGIFVEGKGKLDRDAREKMALVIEQNPDKDIRLLFMRNNKISKVSNTKYSDWCEKRSIKYAISEQGTVPESWIAESGKLSSEREGLDPSSSKASSKPRRKGRSLSDDGATEPTIQDKRQDPETN